MASSSSAVKLTPVERAAIAIGRATQEKEWYKKFQHLFLQRVSRPWVRAAIGRRVYVHNLDWLVDWEPERGVILAGNHRSFFDQWVNMLCLYERGAQWPWRIYFPVRSNFFYENVSGMLVNYLIGAGTMYPPIFRDPGKAALTKDALDRLIHFLGIPGTVVGLHPEGTRNKGDDPYDLLPAQPGIGQIVLQSKPIVVPFFINGLGNDFLDTIKTTYRADSRRDAPVIVVYGEPIDYSEFAAQKPRTALYKRTADLIRQRIIDLMPKEKELRAACMRGEIGNDDPGWIKRL